MTKGLFSAKYLAQTFTLQNVPLAFKLKRSSPSRPVPENIGPIKTYDCIRCVTYRLRDAESTYPISSFGPVNHLRHGAGVRQFNIIRGRGGCKRRRETAQ